MYVRERGCTCVLDKNLDDLFRSNKFHFVIFKVAEKKIHNRNFNKWDWFRDSINSFVELN